MRKRSPTITAGESVRKKKELAKSSGREANFLSGDARCGGRGEIYLTEALQREAMQKEE